MKLGDNELAVLVFSSKDRQAWPHRDCVYYGGDARLDDERRVELPPNYHSEPGFWSLDLEDPHGGDAFNHGACSYEWFSQLPYKVVWIILRSQHLASVGNPKLVTTYFDDLMSNFCKSHPAHKPSSLFKAHARSSDPDDQRQHQEKIRGLRTGINVLVCLGL